MRCNSCWRELDGRAIATTCGHLLCTEDASKILSNDGACPICDQVLSKSHVKPVDVNASDEWLNMAIVGISPQMGILKVLNPRPSMLPWRGILEVLYPMKSSYRSVMFYIGQKELEMQCKTNRVVAQFRQKCEMMHEKYTEKMEQVHTAYQKMAKKCQMLEQENESLSKDKQELQEKFSEKSRQKRKLEEMYDQLKNEYESVKRSAIQPANNFFTRGEPDLFSNHTNMMDNRDPVRKDRSAFPPATPGPREEIWPARQNSSNSGPFDIGSSPAKQATIPIDSENRRAGPHQAYGTGPSNSSMTLRNLILSPLKRPQLSRGRHNMFTL